MTLDSRITFSRASLGTYYDVAGVLKYAAHNSVFPSEAFSAAGWVKGSGASVTADNTSAPNSTLTEGRFSHGTAGAVNGGSVENVNIGLLPAIVSVYAKAGTKTFLVIGSSASS